MGGAGLGPRTRLTTGTHHIRKQTAKPKTDIRRHSFSQRVVNTWNALPDSLKWVDTVLAFKVGFDKWWGPKQLGPSYICELSLHPKFQSPSITPSHKKAGAAERRTEKKNREEEKKQRF